MKKILIICNTPYQIFVATWMRMTILQNDLVDIIISDHMNSGETLAKNAQKTGLFHEVFFVKTKNMHLDRKERWLECVLKPNIVLKRYVTLKQKYDALYAANIDQFTRLVYHTIVNETMSKIKNKNLKIYLFEDGLSTYSKLFEQYYHYAKPKKHRKLFFYNPKQIFGNLSAIFAFDPQCFMWEPHTEIISIQKIDNTNEAFKCAINVIFDYDKMTDVYDRKYIFMEESFYAEGDQINDVEILEKIADCVGKENIMVKIHPRNPVNRFKELGYKTNKDTFVPWEVIVLNQNMEDKVLLTVASSSVINPIRLFGQKTKVYSLYQCLDKIPGFLKGDLWETVHASFAKYYPLIEICEKNQEFLIN